MKGKKIRSLLAVLLALILTFVGINPVVPEVKAEDLTSITWSDFNLTVGTTYTGATDESSASSNAGAYSAATNMNNTVFEGDVIMANGSEMRYGGNNYNQGFKIQVVDDAFVLTSGQTYIYPGNQSGSNEYVNESNGTLTVKVLKTRASEYGLKSFADEQFTLKIQMTGWDGNTGFSGMSLSVWINDVVVEENLSVASGSFGTYFCACVYGSVTPSPKLTKLTWSDFGLTVGTTYTGDTDESSSPSNAGTYSAATNMNNTVFVGEVIMANGSEMRYGGNNYNMGFRMQVVDDAFVLTSGQTFIYPGNQNGSNEYVNESNGTLTVKVLKTRASEYGLESFANEQFTLKIQMTGWDGNTGFSGMSLSVWINDVVVEQNLSVASSSFGTYFCACVYGSVTPSPKKISWEDFGLVPGTTYAGVEADGVNERTGMYINQTVTSLNDTVFEGDVIMTEGSEMRYGGKAYNYGVSLKVSDGAFIVGGADLYLYNPDQIANITIPASDASNYDLTSFAGEQFTLKMQLTGYSGSASWAGMKLSIWINDQAVVENLSIGSSSIGTYFCACVNGSVTPAEPKEGLTPITWKDFTGAEYGKAYTSMTSLNYASGDSLDDTVFEGEVIFGADSYIMYGSAGQWHGLLIGVNASGQLRLHCDCYSGASNLVYDAQNFGDYTTLEGEKITLRVEMTNVTTTSASVNVYVNGYQAGDTISLTRNEGNDAIGYIGDNIVVNPGDRTGTITIPEKDLTPITWKNFAGATYGKTYANDVEGQLTYSGSSLTETAFEDEIIFSAGSALMYAASSSSWHGIHMGVDANGTFFVKSSGYQLQENNYNFEYTCEPSTFDLDSLADEKVKLRVEMRDIGEDATTARFSVWLNDVEVCSNVKVQRYNEDYNLLGNKIWLVAMGTDYSNSVTIPNNIPVPTGLTELSWEEFGYTGGVTYTATVGQKALHLANLDGTMFNGDIKMAAGSMFYYGGNGWQGIQVKVNTDGTLYINAAGSSPGYTGTFNPKHYGLTSFADQKFNLKIAMTERNVANADSGTYSQLVRIYVNDQILGDAFTYTEWTVNVLGIELVMHGYTEQNPAPDSPAITPYSLRTSVPTGLDEIGFDDWTQDEADKVSTDFELRNLELRGALTTLTSLIDTTLYEVVKFVDTNDSVGHHQFVYGGATCGEWYGIVIELNTEGQMQIRCVDTVDGTLTQIHSFTIDPTVAGLSEGTFRGVEFSWKLDTVQVGKNILLYMSFNEKLYNNAPFVFYNFADSISNVMHYNSNEDANLVDNCYVKLGPSVKTLPVLYHDLSDEDYTIPEYSTITFYEKDTNGKWVEATVPAALTETGNYKLEFNDGVSDYIQEIACYHYQTDVSAASLVRSLWMKETGKTTYEAYGEGYETRLCDTNYDGEVNDYDIKTIRSMLVDTYVADETVMRISGFFSPTADMIADATYQKIKATGVNHLIESDMAYSDDPLARYRTYQELAYAQKYGMTVTVQDARLIAYLGEKTTDVTTQEGWEAPDKDDVEAAVTNYKYYQSFDSLFMVDEPKSIDYPKVDPWAGYCQVENGAYLAKAISDAGYKCWTNAFGGDAGTLDNGYNSTAGTRMRNGYYNYLQNLVDSFGLDYISFTDYPFVKRDTDSIATLREAYSVSSSDVSDLDAVLLNLALSKAVAGETLEFRTFVAATASTESYVNHNFSEAQMKWQANMNLAFGSDVLQYFPTVTAGALKTYSDGTCANGLLDSDGNQTKFGDWATSVNTQVAAIDDILVNATHKGFMAVGTYAEEAETTVKSIKILTGSRWDFTESKYITLTNNTYDSYEGASFTLSDNTYGAFAGCFETADGKHAMYIVNYSDVNDNTVTVSSGTSAMTAIYRGVETEYAGSAAITLAPGEAVLVVY